MHIIEGQSSSGDSVAESQVALKSNYLSVVMLFKVHVISKSWLQWLN